MALGIVSRLYSWVNYKAAGRQAMLLCAREKTEQSNCSWETLWFSSVSNRHAAGFPPWDLSPYWLGSETPTADATEQEGQGAFEALPGHTGIGRTRVLSLEGGQSDTFQISLKKICCQGIGADSELPLEHTKLKQRKSQADILCCYPQTVTLLLTGHYILGITPGFLLSWLYTC